MRVRDALHRILEGEGRQVLHPRWWERWTPVDDGNEHRSLESLIRKEARDRVHVAVDIERHKQEEKHGDESCASPTNTDAKRLAILGEEFGEVCKAMTYDNGSEEELIKELVQVAAVCFAWIESRAARPQE